MTPDKAMKDLMQRMQVTFRSTFHSTKTCTETGRKLVGGYKVDVLKVLDDGDLGDGRVNMNLRLVGTTPIATAFGDNEIVTLQDALESARCTMAGELEAPAKSDAQDVRERLDLQERRTAILAAEAATAAAVLAETKSESVDVEGDDDE